MWATLKAWHGNTFTKFNIVTEQIYKIHENKATQKFLSIQYLFIRTSVSEHHISSTALKQDNYFYPIIMENILSLEGIASVMCNSNVTIMVQYLVAIPYTVIMMWV